MVCCSVRPAGWLSWPARSLRPGAGVGVGVASLAPISKFKVTPLGVVSRSSRWPGSEERASGGQLLHSWPRGAKAGVSEGRTSDGVHSQVGAGALHRRVCAWNAAARALCVSAAVGRSLERKEPLSLDERTLDHEHRVGGGHHRLLVVPHHRPDEAKLWEWGAGRGRANSE